MSTPRRLSNLEGQAASSQSGRSDEPAAEATKPLPANRKSPTDRAVAANVTSASRIIGQNLLSSDVTAHFNQASAALRHGHLVRDEAFSLFEAVGALEIGDPKMDSGLLDDGQSIEAEYDCARPVSPREIVWLMDELLCREVAWLTGYPLSQTLFTSSYIDRLLWPEPKSLDDSRFTKDPRLAEVDQLLHLVLRAYCLALVKSCDLVHTMITGQHYYEEEDFASQLFHRELLHRFAAPDVRVILQEALSWLETAVCEEALKLAIQQRLIFRQDIMQILDQDNMSRRYHLARTHRVRELNDALRRTLKLGVPVPGAFSLKLQQRLASSVPPRPMVKVEYTQAIDYFEDLFNDFADISAVCQADGSADVMTAYNLFMSRKHQPSIYIRALLQSLLAQDEQVLGRYADNAFIFDDLQRTVLPDGSLLGQYGEQMEVLSDKQIQVAKHLETFATRSRLPFTNLFRTACLNRCRVRRTLGHAVIEWDQLQADAEEVDEAVRRITNERSRAFPEGGPATYSYPLSSWVYHHKLLQMESLVQMGFELSVYGPEELPSMYWYLSHLCSVHLSHLDRISYFVEKSAPAHSRLLNYQSISEPISRLETCLQFLFRNFTRLKATEALASALHLLYTLVYRRSEAYYREPPYASDRLRYELRMRPFLHLSIPEPPDFEEFKIASALRHMTDTELLDQAQRSVSQAKMAWDDVLKQGWNCQPTRPETEEDSGEDNNQPVHKSASTSAIGNMWMEDVRNAVKACIGTSISIAVLRRNREHDVAESREDRASPMHEIPRPGDKDYWHRFWLVPRITS